jgi:hypothetical protein
MLTTCRTGGSGTRRQSGTVYAHGKLGSWTLIKDQKFLYLSRFWPRSIGHRLPILQQASHPVLAAKDSVDHGSAERIIVLDG